jgi:hypothetical protein
MRDGHDLPRLVDKCVPGVAAVEAVFVDDKAEHVAATVAPGIYGNQFRSTEQTIAAADGILFRHSSQPNDVQLTVTWKAVLCED